MGKTESEGEIVKFIGTLVSIWWFDKYLCLKGDSYNFDGIWRHLRLY